MAGSVVNKDKTIKDFFPKVDQTFFSLSDTVETPGDFREGVYVVDGAGKTMRVTFVGGAVYTFGVGELADNDTINGSFKLVHATGSTVTKVKLIKRSFS